MPIIFLDRIPLPSLNVYLAFTFAVTSASLYYSVKTIEVSSKKLNSTLSLTPQTLILNNGTVANIDFKDIFAFMLQDPFCIWSLLNCGYCVLIIVGKIIQHAVFGELRASENQHLKDKIWNFLFYKFIFVFGVINVQNLDEVLLWCIWFSLLGSFHLLAQLCKDRFEYLSLSTTNLEQDYKPLIGLLITLLGIAITMFAFSVMVGLNWGLSTFAFMAAECILLILCIEHTILRYCLHASELRASFAGLIWDKRGPLIYYTELTLDLAALVIELAHHLHMLLWSNIFLSMASLVICMHIKYILEEIRKRIHKHRNYLWVMYHMEQSYPMASPQELENSDDCAICWDLMESARTLPCSHLFHNGCLQSWLEQDTSCPTCRLPLNIHNRDLTLDLNNDLRDRPNHFFHFDGSRYVSWLPSFSVEVIHTPLVRPPHIMEPNHNSQLDAMARQVQQMFTGYPLSVIIEDLQMTRSIELTVGNILDGRLAVPIGISDSYVLENMSPMPSSIWDCALTGTIDSEDCDDTQDLDTAFSESPDDRQRNLNLRKEKLILAARRRYLEKKTESIS